MALPHAQAGDRARRSWWHLVLPVLIAGALQGCGDVAATLRHRDLSVQTHMSETVFLEPVEPDQRSIYLGVRNTSDNPGLNLEPGLKAALVARGYTVVSDPIAARFRLQANVRYAGFVHPEDMSALLASSFAQPVPTTLSGVVTTNAPFSPAGGPLPGAGLAPATIVASTPGQPWAVPPPIFQTAFPDRVYAVTVDIRLSERPTQGEAVLTPTVTSASAVRQSLPYAPSDGGEPSAVEVAPSGFKTHAVRDVAYADQIGLQPDRATPVVADHLVSSLANLFE